LAGGCPWEPVAEKKDKGNASISTPDLKRRTLFFKSNGTVPNTRRKRDYAKQRRVPVLSSKKKTKCPQGGENLLRP